MWVCRKRSSCLTISVQIRTEQLKMASSTTDSPNLQPFLEDNEQLRCVIFDGAFGWLMWFRSELVLHLEREIDELRKQKVTNNLSRSPLMRMQDHLDCILSDQKGLLEQWKAAEMTKIVWRFWGNSVFLMKSQEQREKALHVQISEKDSLISELRSKVISLESKCTELATKYVISRSAFTLWRCVRSQDLTHRVTERIMTSQAQEERARRDMQEMTKLKEQIAAQMVRNRVYYPALFIENIYCILANIVLR